MTLVKTAERKGMTMTAWESDKDTARQMLTGAVSLDELWLNEVISDCTHAERKTMRAGLDNAPQNLFFDYEKQVWID